VKNNYSIPQGPTVQLSLIFSKHVVSLYVIYVNKTEK
jgi:hypothetical protein